MNKFWILIRREYWEHRALWVAPAVVAALILIAAVFGTTSFGLPDGIDPERKLGLFGVVVLGLAIPFFVVTAIVVLFYLLDSLYAERRDRSILFWKSLPVSDSATVLSKFLVAALIAPLVAWSLGALTSLLSLGIFGLRAMGTTASNPVILWDTGLWLQVQGLILLSLLVAALWYAPIAAYLMVVSAWAKRSVFVWATLPPVFLMIAERYAFDTEHVATFLRERLFGVATFLTQTSRDSIELRIGVSPDKDPTAAEAVTEVARQAGDRIPSIGRVFESFDAFSVLTSPGLWLGALLAVLLLALAVRLRRYRDDT